MFNRGAKRSQICQIAFCLPRSYWWILPLQSYILQHENEKSEDMDSFDVLSTSGKTKYVLIDNTQDENCLQSRICFTALAQMKQAKDNVRQLVDATSGLRPISCWWDKQILIDSFHGTFHLNVVYNYSSTVRNLWRSWKNFFGRKQRYLKGRKETLLLNLTF